MIAFHPPLTSFSLLPPLLLAVWPGCRQNSLSEGTYDLPKVLQRSASLNPKRGQVGAQSFCADRERIEAGVMECLRLQLPSRMPGQHLNCLAFSRVRHLSFARIVGPLHAATTHPISQLSTSGLLPPLPPPAAGLCHRRLQAAAHHAAHRGCKPLGGAGAGAAAQQLLTRRLRPWIPNAPRIMRTRMQLVRPAGGPVRAESRRQGHPARKGARSWGANIFHAFCLALPCI